MKEKLMPAVAKLLRRGIVSSGNKKAKKSPEKTPVTANFDYLAEPKAEFFTVGFGKKSILPPDIDSKKYYIAGYNSNNPAQGVLDEPYAHALWLDDNSGRGAVVFISIDNVGMLKKDVDAIKAALAPFLKETGCRSCNIMSTHSHAGIDTMGIWGALPRSGRDPKYMKLVSCGVCKAVHAAYADKREGELFYGTVEVPDMQEDIRLPEVYSKTLTRFRFVPKDGGREIYMLNFASHSESLQGSNSLVSADFPCYLRKEIQEKTGAETIYCVGAIGGMISMIIDKSDIVESTKNIGKKLAGYAMSVSNERRLDPLFNCIKQDFLVEADNTVLMLAAKIGIIKADEIGIPGSPTGYGLVSEMTYCELGGVPMLLLPCEIFPELVFGGYLCAEESAEGKAPEINPTPLAQIAGVPELLIFGLANDELGYVLPPNDFLLNAEQPYLENARDRLNRKHYEETNSLGPGTAPTIAKVFGQIMEAVKKAKE